MVELVTGEQRARRRFLITAAGRSLAQVEADKLAALCREIARQEEIERQRQARIRRQRARQKARFLMPSPPIAPGAHLIL